MDGMVIDLAQAPPRPLPSSRAPAGTPVQMIVEGGRR
jgi:hypothetical protein